MHKIHSVEELKLISESYFCNIFSVFFNAAFVGNGLKKSTRSSSVGSKQKSRSEGIIGLKSASIAADDSKDAQ